jgi:hypothetical protein
MRETSKRRMMSACNSAHFAVGVAQRAHQQGSVLVDKGFGVLERQIKNCRSASGTAGRTPRDRAVGDGACQRVGCKAPAQPRKTLRGTGRAG